MAERIKIIIDAEDQASRNIKKSQSSLKNLQSAALKVGAVLAGLAVTGRQVYQAIGEGAELQLAEQRFAALATSIGSTSDALLGRFAEATGNTLSNAEMIASASQIISTGLAGNEQDVIRLATVVSELGLDMQQVILTFANNSKMRLDSLGLSVSDVDARTQELVATGMTMDEAFDAAVLELLEERLDLVGSSAETAAGTMKQFNASIANVTDSTKQWLATNSVSFFESLNEIADQRATISEAVADNLISERDAWNLRTSAILWGAESTREEVAALAEAEAALTTHEEAMQRNDAIMQQMGQARREEIRASQVYTNSLDELARQGREAAQVQQWFRDRTVEWTEAGQEALETARYWTEANERMEEQLGGAFFDSLQASTDETTNFNEVMLQAAAQSGANTDALAILAAATGNYTDAQIEAAIETAAMTEKAKQLGAAVADGTLSANEALEAFKNFQAQLQEPYEAVVTADTDEALQRIQEVRAAADAAAGSRTIRFNVVGGQVAGSGTAIGGIPENASGTSNFQGGLTWVGERGPELVALPRGSRIYSNEESRSMGGYTDNRTIINNYRSREAAALGLAMADRERRQQARDYMGVS